MTRIRPVLTGIHARSEALVQATRDHDRSRITDAELAEARRRDLEAVVGTQVAAGYDAIGDGALDWQDLYRPITEVAVGVEAGTLTRYLDTNTFYRAPTIGDDAELTAAQADAFWRSRHHVPAGLPGALTLPSPLSLAAAAADGPPTEDGVQAAGRLLAPILSTAGDHAVVHVTLDEPFAHVADDGAWSALADVLAELETEAATWLRVPFHDAGSIADELFDLPAAGIIVDLVQTDLDAITAAWPGGVNVGLGVVDARTSLVEDPAVVMDAAIGAAEATGADEVLLTSNGDLQHVPETIARRKVRVLAEAAHSAAAKTGGADE